MVVSSIRRIPPCRRFPLPAAPRPSRSPSAPPRPSSPSPSPAHSIRPPARWPRPPGPEPRIAINATNTPGDGNSLFKITQPGSYYLTGNITGVPNKHGIEITSSGVTVDLMGFDLVGVPGMGAFDGVSVTVGSISGITVRHGSVRNWGGDGIDLGTNPTSNTVSDIGSIGNAGNGIKVGSNCLISKCVASSNTLSGISTGSNCSISECTASTNDAHGISTGLMCTINNCTAPSNALVGIDAGSSNRINGCTASGNTTGFQTDFAATISNCTAYNNAERGIEAGSGSTISGCTADANRTDGIYADRSTIVNCTARLNTRNGISVFAYCLIQSNTTVSNGYLTGDGAGIHTVSGSNRIEGNTSTANDRGIEVNFTGNFIVRNICADNTTNWDVPANNYCLVVLATPTTSAITGDSGGLSPGSTNPNANFTY